MIELDFVVWSSSMLWLKARAGLRVHSGWARPPPDSPGSSRSESSPEVFLDGPV